MAGNLRCDDNDHPIHRHAYTQSKLNLLHQIQFERLIVLLCASLHGLLLSMEICKKFMNEISARYFLTISEKICLFKLNLISHRKFHLTTAPSRGK